LNDSFIELANSLKPSFYDNFLNVQSSGTLNGAESPEEQISDAEAVSKAIPLAGVLPLITRTSLLITSNVPNRYLEVRMV
jgi:hypothetical protein